MKESPEPLKDVDIETSSEKKSPSQNLWQKYSNKANGPVGQRNRPGWGRTPVSKSCSDLIHWPSGLEPTRFQVIIKFC